MNRKGYERLGSHSAPLHRWKLIFMYRLTITVLELIIYWFITRPPPPIFPLLANYGTDLENNLKCFAFVSFFVNIACLVMHRTAIFRSTWKDEGRLYKYLILWFSYQTFFVVLTFGFYCFVYGFLEETFEYPEMEPPFELYKEDDEARREVNQVQINFRCCGLNSPRDWSTWQWWVDGVGLEEFRFKVPKSCCSQKICTHASQDFQLLTIRHRGCYNTLMDELETKMNYSCIYLGILSVLHVPHLVVIYFSLPDMKKVNMTYDEFVISKRLFTALYQKSLIGKMERNKRV